MGVLGRPILCLLALYVSLHSVQGVFFHDRSAVVLQPDKLNGSDFGFAMGYWRGSLIVGAPSSNYFGDVYKCPVSSNFAENCTRVELKALSSRHTQINYPDQKFYLGSTIATTKDYFFTCAPLVVKTIKRSRSNTHTDAYGSCFVFTKDGSSFQAKGPDDRFLLGKSNELELVDGGTGWNTLADEVNGILITAKTSVVGDIDYYTPINFKSRTLPKSFLATTDSKNKLVTNKNKLKDMWNIGYGLAAGRFFSKDDIVYAFSRQPAKMKGEIAFMMLQSNKYLALMEDSEKNPYTITDRVVNSMFGYALAAADLNLDGFSELLAGAPAQSDGEDEVEYGALHIYLGGDIESCNDVSRKRTIFGIKEKGRFGTAVAANDVDGDSFPEIFVSAPYEDNDGVVYILSGYELKETLLTSTSDKQVSLTELKLRQRIQQAGMSLFGFSLQVVPDMDENGCDELAIGAPDVSSVVVLKCLQTVTVTINSKLMGPQILKEQDMTAIARVCIHIEYGRNLTNVSGQILVMNDIQGGSGVSIDKSTFTVDLSKRQDNDTCELITVQFRPPPESGDYTLSTQLELIDINKALESKVFDPSLAVLSPHSELQKTLKIPRHCSEDDCKPKLSMNINWSGSANDAEPYKLGSSDTETLYVVVRNDGHEAFGTCVWVGIQGARFSKIGGNQKDGGYECALPTSLKRNASHIFEIGLDMTKLSNTDRSLYVSAKLRENCNNDNSTTEELTSPYSLELEKDLVYLKGNSKVLNITDNDISDESIKSFINVHEYKITNNGSITWRYVPAVIRINKQDIIIGVTTTDTDNCTVKEKNEEYMISCNLTLLTDKPTKISVSIELSKEEIGKYLNKGRYIDETSEMKLYLQPTETVKQKKLETEIILSKDKTFGNDWNLIIIVAVILAILLLALIAYVLYKNGFFKRKEKKRLNSLRDSVRKRSIRLASISRQSQKTLSAADGDHLDMEVIEDCAFEEVPVTTNDDVMLVESQKQVHSQEQHNN